MMAHRHNHEDDYEYRTEPHSRGNGGSKALGITAIALLVIGLVFIAYLTLFNTGTRDRLEVNNFEINPPGESVGESAVREAPSESPTVIELPEPEFNMPALPERSTVDDNVPDNAARTAPEARDANRQGRTDTQRTDVPVGAE